MDVHREPKCSAVVVTVVIIGIASAALGFAAEATSPRLSEVQNNITGACTYPKRPAYRLGIAALVMLLVFRCYCPKTRNLCLKARVCLISSWVAWLAAISFYVVGLVMINGQGEEIRYDSFNRSYVVCHVVKTGIFAAGASFVLLTILLEIIYLAIPTV
ncbi:uncharacterized protein LOC143531566 [Bidens hawaiensis]|uniref:uncharacterized protein LOC143531046 n=1 Tax=Bidens hawaiensis TaxID=980011 RepID=UPI00404A87D8